MRLLWAAFLAVLLAATTSFSQVVISVDENVSKNQDKNLWLPSGRRRFCRAWGNFT